MNAIEVHNLSFSYIEGRRVLKNLSFSVNKGEVIAVIGPNGSGKTTLLYCLAGVIPHLKKGIVEGKILVNGRNILEMKFEDIIKEMKICFLMHNPEEQFVALNVKHELAISLPNYITEAEREASIKEIINQFELEKLLFNTPRELSLGQKQKVIIASIFLRKPEIILLDEPFSFLDLPSQKWTAEFIKNLKKEGKTIIINTHKLDIVKEAVDKVLGIKNGELIFFKSINEFNESNYKDLYGIDDVDESVNKLSYENEVILTVENLFFKYPQQKNWLFQDININIIENKNLGIIGRNGCGKSTLLFIVAGLLKPNKGKVLFKGEDIYKMDFKSLSSKIGIVFQNPDNQLFCDTIEQELVFGLKNQGLSKEEIKKRINFVKQYFNLPDLSTDPNNLSFGWKKILSIAITIAMQPEIILFDEPDLGLDPFFQKKILKLIRELNAKGITILISSHDTKIVKVVAQEVLYLNEKNI